MKGAPPLTGVPHLVERVDTPIRCWDWGMTDMIWSNMLAASDPGTRRAVLRLANERPDWIVVLRGATAAAEKSEPFGGEFAGRWVLQEVERLTGQPAWRPGIRLLVASWLCCKSERLATRLFWSL
jgi:hypothetical protein